MTEGMLVRALAAVDGPLLAAAFARMGWAKPADLFRRYLEEQAVGLRDVLVADVGGRPAGYVTVLWTSNDPVLRERGLPEIADLNVLPDFRRRGIASRLLDAAEARVAERSLEVGIRVGLHSGYGPAQRLYVLRGYLPDATGVANGGEPVPEGATVPLDDDVTLRLTRRLG